MEKDKKKAGSGGRTISMTTYRKIRAAYLERPSINSAAKAAGVKFETARRYIFEGRPEKNMPAIQGLAKREAQKEQAELELDMRAFRIRYRKELLEAMSGSLIEIRLHNARTKKLAEKVAAEQRKGPKGEIVKPSSKFVEQIKAHDMMVRLLERSLGGADETVSVTEQTDFVAKMTPEELVKYIRYNEIPEHLR
ncbi:MAG: hypothetical protein GY841_15780 [FCB group bacterium]|nr:hypothetical protein [FCB group bacterium]